MSDPPKFDAQWKKAADFAEIAEALGVKTTQIMAAALRPKGIVFVLYSPDETDDTRISSIILRRGVDGILFVASEPTERPGLWEEIKAQMERDE